MKIEEAEELVCPFIQNSQTYDRGIFYAGHINCITTKCMAWVCDTSYVLPPNKRADLQYYMERRDPFDHRSEEERYSAFLRQHGEEQESGYCARLKHD